MHSTHLTIGHDQHGTPNALYDGLSRVVVSFPTDRTHDTRRGSPSTPETITANAKLFLAAPELLAASFDLLEILRDMPKGPQHDAMVKLHHAIAKATL